MINSNLIIFVQNIILVYVLILKYFFLYFVEFNKNIPSEEVTWVQGSDELYFRGKKLTSSFPSTGEPSTQVSEQPSKEAKTSPPTVMTTEEIPTGEDIEETPIGKAEKEIEETPTGRETKETPVGKEESSVGKKTDLTATTITDPATASTAAAPKL